MSERPNPGMRPRAIQAAYSTAGRAWLTLAGFSVLLPATQRLGLWLPIHLALAGAAAVTISGNMQMFAAALTATPTARAPLVWTQFVLANAAVVLIAVGYPHGRTAIIAAGGACFTLAILILAWFVWRAWRRGLNRRHLLPLAMYATALTAVIAGAPLGALVGTRAVAGEAWLHLRAAHMTLNVLGFVSLTIAGTLITLLPTVLRVRVPAWRGAGTAGLLIGGLGLLAGGLASGWDLVAGLGATIYAAGTLGVSAMVVAAVRTPRTIRPPAAAIHMLAGVGWFVGGAVALAWNLLRDPGSFDRFVPVFLTCFVGGWIVQTLLGAWLYLLPTARPGSPSDRRLMLAATEIGVVAEVIALNAGLTLLVLRAAGATGPTAAMVGTALALAGGGWALLKAWTFPWLARLPAVASRSRRIWGV